MSAPSRARARAIAAPIPACRLTPVTRAERRVGRSILIPAGYPCENPNSLGFTLVNRDAVSVRIGDEGKVTDRTFNMVDDKGDASLFQLRNSFIQIRHLEGDSRSARSG